MVCTVGEKYDGWCEGEHLIKDGDGKTYCIFHAPLHLKENIPNFNNDVHDRIIGTPVNSICDFRGAVFPKDISFSSIGEMPPVDFSGATFIGEVSFKGLVFKGMADFRGAVFSKKVECRGVTFDHRPTLNRASFSGLVDFRKAKFLDGAVFWNVHFAGDVIFVQTVFLEGVAFNKCVFEKEAQFEKTDFDRVRFDKACFRDHAYFIECGSTGRTSFLSCEFTKSVHFVGTSFVDADYSHLCPGNIAFFKEADLRRSFLKYAHIELFRFSACKWPIFERRRCLYDARKVGNSGFFAIEEQGQRPSALSTKSGKRMELYKPPSAYLLEDLFRRLKKNARVETDEVLASDRHFFEKEVQRIRLREEEGTKILRFYLFAYRWLSGYGESPVLAMSILGLMVLAPLLSLGITDWLQLNRPFSFDLTRALDLLAESCAFLPFAKLVSSEGFSAIKKIALYFWPILVTFQATLLSLAIRNKLRR